MHSAPSASFPVGRSRFFAGLALLIWSVSVCAAIFWCLSADKVGWRQSLMLSSSVFAGAWLLVTWKRSAQGLLRWDGAAWHWEAHSKSVVGKLTAHLDGQRVILASFDVQNGSMFWLWLEGDATRLPWKALRRAVFSCARAKSEPLKTQAIDSTTDRISQ